VKRVGFRSRLFLILLAFALIPSILLSITWSATGSWALAQFGSTAPWDSVAASGKRAIAAARRAPLGASESQALSAHEAMLQKSLLLSRQAGFVSRQAAQKLAIATLVLLAILAMIASRVAGHLSRNLSRPLQEVVGWTELIGRGEPLPQAPPRRGAPEFQLLRSRMRAMSTELELGRARALEAERSAALREAARQVAHELKNPLTPIRFAVERLRRHASPDLAETVEVLAVESQRLEAMAKSFAQFGRLPEGPVAAVDLGELARYTARATVPPHVRADLDIPADVPMIHGHHDALARALSNVMLNAVDACRKGGAISVRLRRATQDGRDSVEIAVFDSGCGIPPDQLARIWDPYMTTKPGGTGLGLAIARQTVIAHDGRVTAESTVGRGTEIRFILPVGDANSGRA
jgi:two-component system, NtrC family, nitrogen regulation sensor histidine kinase NtrY